MNNTRKHEEYLEKGLEHSEKHDHVLSIVRQPKARQNGVKFCHIKDWVISQNIVDKENYDLVEIDRQVGKPTDRQADRQKDRQTDRQTKRQSDRHRGMYVGMDEQKDKRAGKHR